LLLRLNGRRKRVFRLDRNRVALSLDIPSDCIPLHSLPLCLAIMNAVSADRPLSIPERLRGKRANCTAMAVEQPDLELLSGLL
jgi:hypothetical protein